MSCTVKEATGGWLVAVVLSAVTVTLSLAVFEPVSVAVADRVCEVPSVAVVESQEADQPSLPSESTPRLVVPSRKNST